MPTTPYSSPPPPLLPPVTVGSSSSKPRTASTARRRSSKSASPLLLSRLSRTSSLRVDCGSGLTVHRCDPRPEEGRVGHECVSKFRSQWVLCHYKKKI